MENRPAILTTEEHVESVIRALSPTSAANLQSKDKRYSSMITSPKMTDHMTLYNSI